MSNRAILVSDFDGTVTRNDFYRLVRDRLVPEDTPDYWAAYRAGRLTHFEALRAYFAAARPDEETLVALVDEMEIDPDLADRVRKLDEAGWRVVIVSNGCQWYIDRLLKTAGVDLPVLANPGAIEGGRLAMHWPTDSPFPSKQTGVSKAKAVQSYLDEGRVVAFAGDGATDVDPAVLVPPELRFARADLADGLRERGDAFQPFDRWADVADALLGLGEGGAR